MNSHTKEKIALGIFILSVVALIVLIFLAFRGDLTGKVIQQQESEENTQQQTQPQMQPSCSDSDGKNYDIKGRIDYCTVSGCSAKEDSCSGKILKEWYCDGNEAKSEEKTCENDCDSGACLSIASEYYYPYSGGGGGEGTSTPTIPTTTAPAGESYDLGELTTDTSVEILKNDNIKFTISGTAYTLTLTDNTATRATISTNTGKTLNLAVGSEDNSAGFYIKLNSINTITGRTELLLRATT